MANQTNQNKQKKQTANVLAFEKPISSVLTETDINNLFLGFINLIKRNVVVQKEKQYKQELLECQQKMEQYMVTIEQKNTEIETLKKKLKESDSLTLP